VCVCVCVCVCVSMTGDLLPTARFLSPLTYMYQLDVTMQTDHVFFMGDLNYRLDMHLLDEITTVCA
jgi:hypothetical protein